MRTLEKIVYSGKRMALICLLAGSLVVGSFLTGYSEKDNQAAYKNQEVARQEIMRKYFPLKVGNTWKYIRTANKDVKVWHFSSQTVEKSSRGIPKGKSYFTVTPANAKPMPQISEETYTIIEQGEDGFWKVKVEGNNPRDGRYSGSRTKENPTVRWGYIGIGVMEVMDGKYSGADTTNQTLMVLLEPDKMLYPGESPDWAIAAKSYNQEITVPAGTFSKWSCLMNCTMIGGTNLAEVLSKNAPAKYSQDFGFRTESFYAKDVGLLKEVQYNAKGDIAYKLELKSYEVK